MRRIRKIDSGLYEIVRGTELLGYVAKASPSLWIAVSSDKEVMADTKKDAVARLIRLMEERRNDQPQEA